MRKHIASTGRVLSEHRYRASTSTVAKFTDPLWPGACRRRRNTLLCHPQSTTCAQKYRICRACYAAPQLLVGGEGGQMMRFCQQVRYGRVLAIPATLLWPLALVLSRPSPCANQPDCSGLALLCSAPSCSPLRISRASGGPANKPWRGTPAGGRAGRTTASRVHPPHSHRRAPPAGRGWSSRRSRSPLLLSSVGSSSNPSSSSSNPSSSSSSGSSSSGSLRRQIWPLRHRQTQNQGTCGQRSCCSWLSRSRSGSSGRGSSNSSSAAA